MFIKSVDIENFKGISKLKFNPKKINILVGKNNTGKTSVLEAIDLLFHNENIQNPFMHSFFNIYSEEKSIKISANFGDKEEKIEIREAKEREAISNFSKDLVRSFLENFSKKSKKTFSGILTRELEKLIENYIDDELRNFLLKNSLVLLDGNSEEKIYYSSYDYSLINKIEILIENITKNLLEKLPSEQRDDSEFRRHLKYASENTLFSTRGILMEHRHGAKPIKKDVVYINSLEEELYGRRPISQRKPEDSERLHKVEKIVKENNLVRNLEGLDFDNVVFQTKEGIKAHSFHFLGDGFKSMIGLLWKLADKINNIVVMLDEPEKHIHPGYIKQLMKFIIDFSKRLNIQFFITTHSLDLLDIVLSEELDEEERAFLKDELNILRMDKIRDSITIAENLDYEKAVETKDELQLDLRGV